MQAFLDACAAALVEIAAAPPDTAPDLSLAGIGSDELAAIVQDWA
jgi:hypothetical protein